MGSHFSMLSKVETGMVWDGHVSFVFKMEGEWDGHLYFISKGEGEVRWDGHLSILSKREGGGDWMVTSPFEGWMATFTFYVNEHPGFL